MKGIKIIIIIWSSLEQNKKDVMKDNIWLLLLKQTS